MTNLKAALEHAGRGWWVHPCGSDKKPLTKHGKDDATTDGAIIRGWWERWPAALIGLSCERSGFFAVDIDTKNGVNGWSSWSHLVETVGEGQFVTCGPAQWTPSGGAHMLFKLPDEPKIPNNAGKVAPGIDLRSKGYICTGGAYRWMDDHGPDQPLIDAPDWLLNLIRDLAERSTRSHNTGRSDENLVIISGNYFLKRALEQVRPGNRNDTGFWLACQLRDSGMLKGDAESLLVQYAAGTPPGDHPYSESEALASLESAYNGTPRLPAITAGKTANSTADHVNWHKYSRHGEYQKLRLYRRMHRDQG